ncbi:hypothetical protein F4604DRAFT_1919569 [Suillus subluteus]|nr:hypothetical protein F4604DRAFT_1919569 [Suillus subluteus]
MTVQPAKSQATTTRAWAQVHSVEWIINLNTTIYKKCRAQLSHLGTDELLEKYRELEKGDFKATSAVGDPNTRGQRNSTLPWFWSLDVQGDTVSNDWMNEWFIGFLPRLCATVEKNSSLLLMRCVGPYNFWCTKPKNGWAEQIRTGN